MQEELKARKYVMRIDRESKRREKIMHELVDKIEKSGLLKKDMRDEINQMILVNFLRKEKEEKGTERYNSLKLIFKKEQERYEELEKLREQLGVIEKEEKIVKKKIKGIEVVEISDESKLDEKSQREKQFFNEYDKLKSEKAIIQQKVNEIEKELEEIERIYGRKIGEDEVTDDNSNMGDEKKSGDDKKEKDSKEIKETGEITVKDMKKKDEIRLEILKLLRKSDRLDGNQKAKIRESISDRYVAKIMDMQGWLETFGVVWDKNKIGGKFVYKVKTKDGKWEIYRGEKKICDGCDEIGIIREYGGKPLFKVKKNGKWGIYRGYIKLCEGCDEIEEMKTEKGEVMFRAKKNGKWSIYRGKEMLCDGCDEIGIMGEYCGKPLFKVKKDGKWSIYRGKEILCDGCDEIKQVENGGGNYIFLVKRGGLFSVYLGRQHVIIGNRYEMWNIGGKPFFYGHGVGYDVVIRGTDYVKKFKKIGLVSEIGGKPAFAAQDDQGRESVYRGNEKVAYGFHNIMDYAKIGEKFAVVELIDDYYTLYLGKKYWTSRNRIYNLKDLGGEIMFETVYNEYLGMDGDVIDEYTVLSENIGGKSLVQIKHSGSYSILRGGKKICGGRIRYWEEKNGIPLLMVKRGKRYYVYYGFKDMEVGNKHESASKAFDLYDNNLCEKNNEKEKTSIAKGQDIKGEGNDVNDGKNKAEEYELEEKNEERDGNTNSQIEKREKFILEWYIKKRNRDDLFNILDLCIVDRKKRREIKDVIFKDFEKNYEETSSDEEIKTIGENYKKLRGIERQMQRKIQSEKDSHIGDMIKIYEKLYEFAKMEMEVMKKGKLLKKIKLKLKRIEGKKLELRQKEILEELEEMREQKLELEEKMGKRRKVKISKEVEGIERFREYKSNRRGEKISPKKYIELYEEMIRYKRENMESLIEEIGKMDIGVGEEVKEEVKERIRKAMSEEIEDMKKGSDERLEIAKNMKKKLEEKVQKYKDYISELEIKIAEKQNELEKKQKEFKEKQGKIEEYDRFNNEIGYDSDDLENIYDEISVINKEIIGLQNEKIVKERELEEDICKYEEGNLEN